MTIVSNILLMGPPAPGQNPLITFAPYLLIIVVFYFFMIRPQMKRQKELKNFQSSLKRGDRVITTGGIYGKIHEISDQSPTLVLEIDNNVHIKIDKSAVLRDPSDLNDQK